MSRATRALRLDTGTWHWLESEASWTGSTLVALGAYFMLAFDRFGWPDFAIRATTRFLLTGLYGWLWLAATSWMIVRLTLGIRVSPAPLLRLTGHAHLPLLLVAVLIQVVTVTFNVTDVALWPAMFAGVFWMPAMLTNAVSASSQVSLRRAAAVVAVPYLLWLAVIGRYLWSQLGHLL